MKRAFTLIELLVVMAAILFPAFAQAIEAAKKTACLSNVKQIGLATPLDRGDADGRMFFRNGFANSRSGNIPTANAKRGWNRLVPHTRNRDLLRCPSDAVPTPSKDVDGNLTVQRSSIAIAPAESLVATGIENVVDTPVTTEKWG